VGAGGGKRRKKKKRTGILGRVPKQGIRTIFKKEKKIGGTVILSIHWSEYGEKERDRKEGLANQWERQEKKQAHSVGKEMIRGSKDLHLLVCKPQYGLSCVRLSGGNQERGKANGIAGRGGNLEGGGGDIANLKLTQYTKRKAKKGDGARKKLQRGEIKGGGGKRGKHNMREKEQGINVAAEGTYLLVPNNEDGRSERARKQ